jgi:hypothetical protein
MLRSSSKLKQIAVMTWVALGACLITAVIHLAIAAGRN